MDKASDYESGDSRFESWQGRRLLPLSISMPFAFLTQAGAREASASPDGRYECKWHQTRYGTILLLKLVRIGDRRGQFDKETSKIQASHMLKHKLHDLQSAVFVLGK